MFCDKLFVCFFNFFPTMILLRHIYKGKSVIYVSFNQILARFISMQHCQYETHDSVVDLYVFEYPLFPGTLQSAFHTI